MTHPLNIAWMSENTGSVGKRTIASGAVIGAANIYGSTSHILPCQKISYLPFAPHHLAWGSQIYQASDSPDYRRGNTANVAISGCTILLWLAQKAYYKYKNIQRQKALASLDENERRAEELQAETLGNQSILYKFSS